MHYTIHYTTGGLAGRQDARGQLHGVGYARGHAAEGERQHHGGLYDMCICSV